MVRTLKYSLFFAACLLIISGLGSCGRNSHLTAQLSRLDSLESALKHIESGLKDIDREQVKESYVSCKDKAQKLYAVFQKDPLAVDEKLMTQYEKLIMGLNRLVMDIDNAEKEIQFGIEQIGIWRQEVKKGDLEADNFNQYCQNESEAIHSLELMLVTKSKEWSTLKEQTGKLDPAVKRLIQR